MEQTTKRINDKQKEFLVDFMKTNYEFLFGKFANSSGKKSKDEKWDFLAAELNRLGPPTKDTTLWKKAWNDARSAVKNKLKLIRQNRNRTGGGPIDLKLSDYEEKIVSICKLPLLDGDQDLGELGFSSSPPKPFNDDSMPIDIDDDKENIGKRPLTEIPTNGATSDQISKRIKRSNPTQVLQVERAIAASLETNTLLRELIDVGKNILEEMKRKTERI